MLGLEKYKRSSVIIGTIVGTITVLILAFCCIYAAMNGANMHVSTGGLVVITFFILPYLIIGGFYGYLISSIVFLISFICTLVVNMNDAYKMPIYLVAALCFSVFGQYLWFGTIKKTALAALFTLIATSFTELLCLSVLETNEYTLSQIIQAGTYFYRDACVIIVTSFLFHFYFTKTPDSWKYPFPIAVAYTGYYQNDKELSKRLRKTKVSVKITAIIIGVELLLGVSVAIFMVVLFPDIKDMFAVGMRPVTGNLSELSFEEMMQHIEEMTYTWSGNALSYDIKMVLLMMCVGVPMASIANFYTKIAIGAPLGYMSDFMQEYANADDEKKLEVGRGVDNIKIRSHDEIQVVYESIQATVHAIEDYIAHINADHELEKELEVAQKASEAKSSFLSNMSHEIRTPINAVLGLNEMILRESNQDQILEYASSVKSAGNSLLGIVNDILDFSKIEAGKMDILPVEYDISSTINDLLNLVAVKADNKGLVLNFNIDKSLPQRLIGDEIRIKQCVTNILTNAVKYTETGGVNLNVSCRKIDDDNIFLRFEVIDTGIGIKEEDIEKLYSPFERIEEIRNRSIEGTGLGMSIVKKLLALMDTKLEVKSVYGEGSTFSFEVKQQVASWEELGDFRERYKEFLRSQKKYKESFIAPDARILVVDDTPINLTVVKGLLNRTRIRVDTAGSGFETLELVKKKKYDAILIDHRMPEMDGVETLKALKEMEDNLSKDAPCIALTANAGAGARAEYIAAGFNDYLSKPVNGELLEEMLKEYLPKEKLLEAEMESDELSASEETENADNAEDAVLDQLQGIDLAEAERNCGSRELLKNVVKEFLTTIDSKAKQIEHFAQEGDLRNYTVTVHALKSSARLIGAMELSGMAAHLEECGNNEDEKEINEKTPELLALFRSYNEKLSAINGPKREKELPEIGIDELKSAFGDMRELLEAYDFDTADGIMNMLSDYSIPEEYKEKYEKVRTLMSAVDRDELLKIL
nr:response regulator [uncultured Butyrivibrio sp.]